MLLFASREGMKQEEELLKGVITGVCCQGEVVLFGCFAGKHRLRKYKPLVIPDGINFLQCPQKESYGRAGKAGKRAQS